MSIQLKAIHIFNVSSSSYSFFFVFFSFLEVLGLELMALLSLGALLLEPCLQASLFKGIENKILKFI
jgi:hypothetical protein